MEPKYSLPFALKSSSMLANWRSTGVPVTSATKRAMLSACFMMRDLGNSTSATNWINIKYVVTPDSYPIYTYMSHVMPSCSSSANIIQVDEYLWNCGTTAHFPALQVKSENDNILMGQEFREHWCIFLEPEATVPSVWPG